MKTLYSEYGSFQESIKFLAPDKIFVLTDENVKKHVVEKLYERGVLDRSYPLLILPSGEESKTLNNLEKVWKFFLDEHGTKRSVLVNVGGGMITDLGGFAAATFKRGIRYFNMPTTLLGALDASVGGKTGIDFQGYKNLIGAFYNPTGTYFPEDCLETLPEDELLSGYGELIKTGFLISEEKLDAIYIAGENLRLNREISGLIADSVEFKLNVVREDPFDRGVRKILNFGHTAGHAFESLMLRKGRPVAHGIAVAHGILVALIISVLLTKLEPEVMNRYIGVLKERFPRIYFDCDDYEELLSLMREDKKNEGDQINFTLLEGIGKASYNCEVDRTEVESALDIYRSYMGV